MGGFVLVFLVLVFYIFPKGLYRELSGVVQRPGTTVKGAVWTEEEIKDFYYKC